jgi:transposase
MMRRDAPREDRRARIEGPPPGRPGHVGVTAKGDRPFVEAALHRDRAGVPWRDPPARFGARKKVRARFRRRAGAGVRARVFERSAGDAGDGHATIDGTIVRARRHGAGAAAKGAATGPSGAAGAARARRATPPSTRSATRPGSRPARGGGTSWGAPTRRCPTSGPRRRSPTGRSTPRGASPGPGAEPARPR